MNSYDTIKIVTSNNYLLKRLSEFNIKYNPKTGIETGRVFCSKSAPYTPFNIYVAEDRYNKLTIEFSSKILLDKYPLLINTNTIEECLHNLEKLEVCKVNIENVIETGVVTSCDVTRDISTDLTPEILHALNENVGNYRRFNWKHYEKEGVEFVSNVKHGKEVFKLYDKPQELTTAKNSQFLKMLNNPQAVLDYFEGKTRFEASFNTKAKVEASHGIANNYLKTVLSSTSNPLLYQFDKVFDVNKEFVPLCLKSPEEWEMCEVLKHNDLKSIEQEIRKRYPSRSGAANKMKKYQHVHNLMQQEGRNIVQEVRSLLVV